MPRVIPVLSRDCILPLTHRGFSSIAGRRLRQGAEREERLERGRRWRLMAKAPGTLIDWQV